MTNEPVVLLGAILLCAQTGAAVDLKPETAEAFDQYIAALEMHLDPQFRGKAFLWSDQESGLREKLLQGEIVVRPANGTGLIAVKNGLIQDWQGAIFIPHSSLKMALGVLEDYDRDKEIYKPEIADSKLRSRQGDEFQVYLRMVKSKFFLSDVLNAELKNRFTSVDGTKVYGVSYSTRIAEVSEVGKSGEHELPVGQDRGLLWRLYTYRFLEERDGGVYLTVQSVSLTRSIPLGMGKILGPLVRDVPGEALRENLEQTRDAVTGK